MVGSELTKQCVWNGFVRRAKKYPVKLHNGSRPVYGGSHDCLLYLETGWEKEAWCEVLRASANWVNDTDDWYFKLKKEYDEYLHRVEQQFPFLRGLPQGTSLPRTAGEEKERKTQKSDIAAITKKRLLWKKLTRRSMKNKDNKSGEREREESRRSSDEAEDGSSKGASIANTAGESTLGRTASLDEYSGRGYLSGPEDSTVTRLASYSSNAEILSSAAGDRDTTQNESLERSLLCANLLFSRLFFDLYHSSAVVTRIRATLQAGFTVL